MGDPIDALSAHEARVVLKQLREILWPLEDPDIQWSPDTLDAIGDLMEDFRMPEVPACIRDAEEQVAAELPFRRPHQGRFWVYLSSVGNPDHGQYAPLSDAVLAWGANLAEIRQHCEAYRSEWNLGGGNWPGAPFGCGRTVIGHVSYNLRLWEGLPGDPAPREIHA